MPPLPSLLVFVILQGTLAGQRPPVAACEGLQRIELAVAPVTAAALEICISPGLMTSFIFDARADVDLQEEVRFMDVTRGHSTFSFLPPRDMLTGEHLRMTARLGQGASQQSVTFSLVAHSGQATHQVEVYRDPRPRESYQHEVAQERAKNQRLHEQLDQLQAQLGQLQDQLEQAEGLRNLIASNIIGVQGVQAQRVHPKVLGPEKGPLSCSWGTSYRTDKSIAAELWLMNSSSEPWIAAEASLVDEQGKELKGVKLRQEHPIARDAPGRVIVEVEMARAVAPGPLTLTLREEGPRGISIAQILVP